MQNLINNTRKQIADILNEIALFEQEMDKRLEQGQVVHGSKKMPGLGVKTLLKLSALKSVATRLRRLDALLKIDKYDFAFIGKVGTGKTTSICHLFNLLREEKILIDVGDSKVEDNAIKEILATGAGKTTICEVVIRPGSSTFLEVDPYSQEEVKQSIEIFCTCIWKRVNPTSVETSDVSESDQELVKSDALPAELMRAVRNLVGLKHVIRQGNQVDQAIELANQYSSYRDFKDNVIKRAKLSGRNKTNVCPNADDLLSINSQKIWIENKFKEINLCILPDVSIPRKIYVNLSPEILDFTQYPIKSIIDTRGIDEGKDREDLSRYIRDEDTTICIFTEKFSDVPTNVIWLIGKYLTPESKDINTKLAIVAMPRKGEPSKVIGQNGQVSNKEEGINVRLNQIKDSFQGKNIAFLDKNIWFYDALQFYDDEHKTLKYRCTQDHVDQDRERILNELSELVKRRKQKFCDEAHQLGLLTQKIRNGELSPEDENRLRALKKTIEQYRQTNFSFRFENDYLQSLKGYHVMVFRAANNRCGIYEYRGINIYFDARSLTEEIIRNRFGKPKFEIVGAIKNTEEAASKISGMKPVLEVLRSQIDQDFENLAIDLGQEIYEILRDDKFAPLEDFNPFWMEIQGRWGQGKGYRNDVLFMYQEKINSIDELLEYKSQDSWERKFMNKILVFFDED